jgi:hypothetical protein
MLTSGAGKDVKNPLEKNLKEVWFFFGDEKRLKLKNHWQTHEVIKNKCHLSVLMNEILHNYLNWNITGLVWNPHILGWNFRST